MNVPRKGLIGIAAVVGIVLVGLIALVVLTWPEEEEAVAPRE